MHGINSNKDRQLVTHFRKYELKHEIYVSRDGTVYNANTGHTYKPTLGSTGYYSISLQTVGYKNGHTVVCIHKLVMDVFNPAPSEGLVIDHIDNDKSNNHIDNLKWVTAEENSNNRKSQNLGQLGIQTPKGYFRSKADASKAYGFDKASILQALAINENFPEFYNTERTSHEASIRH